MGLGGVTLLTYRFVVEVPTQSQLLKPDAAHLQALRSHSDASPASDDGSLATKVERLEKWVREIDERVKQMGG